MDVADRVKAKGKGKKRNGRRGLWLVDSSGHPSMTVTFLKISFAVTTLAYLASIVTRIGSVEFRAFDAAASSAYFGLLLGTYVARRATEAKWGNPNVPDDEMVQERYPSEEEA